MRSTSVLFLLSSLISLVYSSGSSDLPACYYDTYKCSYVIAEAIEADGPITDAKDCQQACVDDPDAKCQFWTYEQYGPNPPLCFLLPTCDEADHEQPCDHLEKCVSGPKECTDCDPLTYVSDVNTQMWTCLGESRPYSNSIPSGTLCRVSCPTWDTTTVTAKCEAKGWIEVTPPDAKDSANEAIESPAVLPNPKCTCNSITIPANTLETEPNGAGAELYCDKGSGYEIQNPEEQIDIESTWHCVFLCDRHPVLDFSCINGYWSDGVEDCKSIYCYDPPTDEKCGLSPSTTTPAPSTTTSNP